jgi:DNA-binding helix-hairpin-helix protein with protein kinase domain
MEATLSCGTVVPCDDMPLGEGGVAKVYRCRDGKNVIKLYKDAGISRRSVLHQIIETYGKTASDPSWEKYFCWPNGIVIAPKLGVRMVAAPSGMKELSHLVLSRAYGSLPDTEKVWSTRLRLAIGISRAVARLNRAGLAHSDLSSRNILVDAVQGTARLIDLDGLVVQGHINPQVCGTPEYMAPEIVDGIFKLAPRVDPSTTTDAHSLAVILHQLLLFGHPLKGGPRANMAESDGQTFGSSGLYIHHPNDASNRVQCFHPPAVLGTKVERLFHRAFVDGLKTARERPTSTEWESAMLGLWDTWIPCDHCAQASTPVPEKGSLSCVWCGRPCAARRLPLLEFLIPDGRGGVRPDVGKYMVGWADRPIHEWHVNAHAAPGPGEPGVLARFVQDSSGDWQLRNESLPRLEVQGVAGRRCVSPGDAVAIEEGLVLWLDSQGGRAARCAWR